MNTNYTQLNTGKYDNTSGLVNTNPLKTVSTAASQNISNLQPGQVFTGQITDIRNGSVFLALDQQTIQAKFEGTVNLCIGEVLQFVVKENSNNKLVLSPYQKPTLSTEEHALYKALDAAELPSTDKNIDLVSVLLKNQMPVDKNSIHRFISLSLQYPNVSMETLVSMAKYHIDITPEHITQFMNYKNQEHQLTNDLKQLAVMLPETIEAVFDHMGAKETVDFLDKLVGNPGVHPENETGDVSETLLLKQVIKQLKDPNMPEDQFKQLLQSKEFQKAIQEELLNQWSFRPEQLSKDEIETTFKKIENHLQAFAEQISYQGSKLEQVASTVKNMQDNIHFMKNLNDNLVYSQLPLQLSNQITHSDLYVYTNRKARVNKADGIHLLLHLDMEYLGQTNISIKMRNSSLNLNFSLSDQEAANLLTEHMEELRSRLVEKGYAVQWDVTCQEESGQVDFVNDFLAQDETKPEVKHYSFDMRV